MKTKAASVINLARHELPANSTQQDTPTLSRLIDYRRRTKAEQQPYEEGRGGGEGKKKLRDLDWNPLTARSDYLWKIASCKPRLTPLIIFQTIETNRGPSIGQPTRLTLEPNFILQGGNQQKNHFIGPRGHVNRIETSFLVRDH